MWYGCFDQDTTGEWFWFINWQSRNGHKKDVQISVISPREYYVNYTVITVGINVAERLELILTLFRPFVSTFLSEVHLQLLSEQC